MLCDLLQKCTIRKLSERRILEFYFQYQNFLILILNVLILFQTKLNFGL